jgi:hypothetical protein
VAIRASAAKAVALPRQLQREVLLNIDMVWNPVFVMEFIAFGGGVPPAELASGGDEPDGSHGA